MPAIDDQARSIFLSALEMRPEDWPAFLNEACGGDAEVRARVDQLLQAHEALGSIHAGGLAATVDQPPTEGPGTIIGPYKLIEAIGEGGMGAVYLAQQTEPVKRLVALKVIKAGMDSRQVIARFEAERQALALMDHPNIAKVLDGGTTPTGRPYFVMELVKGVAITRFCDERKLTPRQRLELFLPVCHAIQHAHQKGLIHRDIKPTNVLVALYDGLPVPKVIDFGVAKATGQPLTERTLVTGLGAVVGTPEYMSPEQAELNQLDIDTRSDVYSLGVLLYELLTGTTPLTRKRLKEAALLEVLRVIREEEPQRPSTRLSTTEELPSIAASRGTEPARLSRLVRGELDWVVMKALEKDRNRRYETANGFAMDLQRYLAGEAVQAVPPSAGYRLRKFARRNKGGLAVAGLVLFFLVLLGSGVGWAVRDRSAREAEAAQQKAARQAKVAGQVEPVLAEVDRLEKEQKWPEALAVARRAEAAVAGGEADVATAERVRRRVKDLEFIDQLEQIRMQRATFVEGKFDDARADREYGRTFRGYGVDLEELTVEQAIDRLKTRLALAIPVAAALDDWVQVRLGISKTDAARWKRLVAVARGIDPEPLRDRLRSTWGRHVADVQAELHELADSIDIRAQQPATLVNLATSLKEVHQLDSALRLLRDAQYVYPGDFWLNFNLGFALHGQKDYEGAIRYCTAAVSIRPNSSPAHNHLGMALAGQKKLDEAVARYRKAIELDPKFAKPYYNLGNSLGNQKKLDEAIAAYRKAIHLEPKYAEAYGNLGVALTFQGKLADAIACQRKAIELDPKSANARYNLGVALERQGKAADAVAAYCKAIELDPKFAKALNNLVNGLKAQGKLDEAIAGYRMAITVNPKFAPARNYLGNALMEKGWDLASHPDPKLRDFKRAVAASKEAVELAPQSVLAWQYLGWVQYRAGNWKASIEALEKSCKLQEGGTGDSYQWIVLALAHAQLAADEGLPEAERARHQTESRRWYEPSAKDLDSKKWTTRPSAVLDQAVWDFRQEAQKLIGSKQEK
jgi:serine/threonine protein kinase/Flp pilus assembly protein TadD